MEADSAVNEDDEAPHGGAGERGSVVRKVVLILALISLGWWLLVRQEHAGKACRLNQPLVTRYMALMALPTNDILHASMIKKRRVILGSLRILRESSYNNGWPCIKKIYSIEQCVYPHIEVTSLYYNFEI